MMKKHFFFLLEESCETPREGQVFGPFRGAVSVWRGVINVVGVIPQERISERTVEQGPQVVEEILAVVEVIPLERIFERTEEQFDDLTVQQVVRRFSS